VHVVFVFDTEILDALPRADRRVEFIRESLVEVDAQLRALAGHPQAGLIVRHGVAKDKIVKLAQHLQAQVVFANHDDEPLALARDIQVRGHLADHGIVLNTFKDHVVFERNEVLTQMAKPFSVFTPYKNAWLKKVTPEDLQAFEVTELAQRLAPRPDDLAHPVPSLQDMGFEPTNLQTLKIPTGESGAKALLQDFLTRIDQYEDTRNFPAVKGPSYLGVHLRFGTVSIRELAAEGLKRQDGGSAGAAVWLSELIWRDFYAQILSNFPRVAMASIKPDYDAIAWETGPAADALFAAWCEGRTGYPLVDAAMAQINQTGYMHNRLRMVAACFLIKDLGIDWRRGEAYFAEKLNDFDLSSNNGGWQWASSSGCDAQPYFRIFNPVSQSLKFDPEGKFIRKYLPQLAGLQGKALHSPWEAAPLELAAAGVALGKNYPLPLVRHDEARARTLQRYAVVKKTEA
jgi:deoxyribodipyrimidine photo-lyase